MTDFTTPESDTGIARKSTLPIKPAIALALAAFADWFYDQPVGLSVVIFTIALLLGSLLANFATIERSQLPLAALLATAGLVPAFEEFNGVSLAFIMLSLGICLRIVLNRSNGWLIRANLIVLTATLYVCALVDLTPAIADYNVSHSREASGKGVWLDANYLAQLGPQALPAIDRAIALGRYTPYLDLRAVRYRLLEQQQKDTASWRTWGFRSWRLQRTLDAQQNSTTG